MRKPGRVSKLCEECGVEILVQPARLERTRFCSKACMGNGREMVPIVDRFWPKVDRSGGPDACWPWTASRNDAGYGQISRGKNGLNPMRAHRLAWEIANGKDPGEYCVCHDCDNPPCCNPKHLFLGTHADNIWDMTIKGRHYSVTRPELAPRGDRHGSVTKPNCVPRGERSGLAKLSDENVRYIRELRASGVTTGELSTWFGVTRSAIKNVMSRKTWGHVA